MVDTKQKMNPVRRVAQNLRITKVVVTRSLSTPSGSFFVAFSAASSSTQCDFGGEGADALPTKEEDDAYASQGLTLAEADIARTILARNVELAVLSDARLAGAITEEMFADSVVGVKNSFNAALARMMVDPKAAAPTQESDGK